jgi:hypothetical protein
MSRGPRTRGATRHRRQIPLRLGIDQRHCDPTFRHLRQWVELHVDLARDELGFSTCFAGDTGGSDGVTQHDFEAALMTGTVHRPLELAVPSATDSGSANADLD